MPKASGKSFCWANESYTYDAAGNRETTTTGTAATDTLQATTSTTTTGNQLESDGTFIYSYDADGNVVQKERISQAEAPDFKTVYSYDNAGRLVEATTEDNTDTITQNIVYTYNSLGERVGETVTVGGTSTVTKFAYDLDGNVAATFDGSNNLTGTYVYGQAVDQLLAQEDGSGNVNWMTTDRDQSVRDVVQYNGTTSVVDHIDYNSFGVTISESNPSAAHIDGYAGYVNDLALGMLETQSRIYNPSTGEFISQDPSGFSGSADGNLYEYAGNSPIDMVDPSGLSQANPLASLNFSTPVPIANTPVNFGLDANGNVPDPGISPETLALLQNAVSAAPGSTDAPASGDDASEGSEDDDVEAARASLQQEILQTGQSTAPAAQASATTSLSPLGDADIATLKEDFPMLPGEGEADYLAQYGFYRAGNPNSTDSSGGVTTEQLIQAIQDSGVQTGTRPPDPLYAIAFGSGTQNTSGYYNCVTPPAPQSSGADLFADIDLAARQTFGDSAVDFTEAAVPAAVKTTAVVVGGTVVLGGVAAFSPLIAGGAAIGGLWYWAYNVGWSAGERTADGQTATESWGGSLADNSPVGPLVKGTANVDPGTWQPLNLTPSQQGTQFGTGVGGIAGVVAAPYVYNATQSAVGSALSELTPPTFAPPLKTPEQMALDALNPNKGIPGNFPGVSDYSPPPPGIGPGSSRPLAPYTPYTPPSMPPGGRGPLGPPPGPDWFPPPGSGWDRFPPDVRPGGSGPIPPFSNN